MTKRSRLPIFRRRIRISTMLHITENRVQNRNRTIIIINLKFFFVLPLKTFVIIII